MKKLISILAILAFLTINTQGQITLENSYTGVSAAYIHLPVAGYKYYVMDVANSQCLLYNNDHSLWKTINLSIPANYYLYDVQYVTENLFNSDNTIELLYVSYIYNSVSAYYTYDTRIATENGNILLSLPGCGYSAVYTAQSGSKLLTWIYDYSVSPSRVTTQVYTIPGQVANDIYSTPIESHSLLQKAFPNPATNSTTIPYTLPANINQAELKIYNTAGMAIKSYTVDHTFNSILVQTNDFPVGIYVYRIESANFKSESYKLVISK